MDIRAKEIMDDELDQVIGGRGGRFTNIDNYSASFNYCASDSYEKIQAKLISTLKSFNIPTNGVPSAAELKKYGIMSGKAGTLVYECRKLDGSLVRCGIV